MFKVSVKSETIDQLKVVSGRTTGYRLGRSCNTVRHADLIKQIGVALFRYHFDSNSDLEFPPADFRKFGNG